MIVYYSYQLCLGVTVNRECLLQILILEFVVYFSSRKYHLIVLIQNIFYNSNFKAKIKKILKNKAKSQINKDTNNENSLDEKNPNSKESAKQKRTIFIYMLFLFYLLGSVSICWQGRLVASPILTNPRMQIV